MCPLCVNRRLASRLSSALYLTGEDIPRNSEMVGNNHGNNDDIDQVGTENLTEESSEKTLEQETEQAVLSAERQSHGQSSVIGNHVDNANRSYDRHVIISQDPVHDPVDNGHDNGRRRPIRARTEVERYNVADVMCCICGKKFRESIPVKFYGGKIACSLRCLEKGL